MPSTVPANPTFPAAESVTSPARVVARQVVGAALLGATMVGAILAHMLILGPSIVPATVLGLMSAAVLYIHRAQIQIYLGRLQSV